MTLTRRLSRPSRNKTGLTPNTDYWVRVDAEGPAGGTGEGVTASFSTPSSEGGTGKRPAGPGEVVAYFREFDADSDPVTLIAADEGPCTIEMGFVQTDNLTTGPWVTITRGDDIIFKLGD